MEPNINSREREKDRKKLREKGRMKEEKMMAF